MGPRRGFNGGDGLPFMWLGTGDSDSATAWSLRAFSLYVHIDACMHFPCMFAYVQVSLMQNLAPTSGTLTVLPARGHVLETVYQLSAEQWVDPKVPQEDYPLSFSFGYMDSSGFPKLLSSGSMLSSISTLLPSGSDSIGCPVTESLCRRLQLTVKVFDAAFASSEPALPTFVRIDNMDPTKIKEIIKRELAVAQTLEAIPSGMDLMSKCATIADTMNDRTVNFEFYGISLTQKAEWRDQMIRHLDVTARKILVPLTVQAVLQALGTASSIVGADLELTNDCVDKASKLIQDLTTMLLKMARAGYLIPGMPAILRHIRVSLGQTAAASSRLASEGRRSSISMLRLSLPGQSGMDVITTVNGLSKLSVSAHAAGQQTAEQSTPKFTMKTDRVEVDDMSGFSDAICGLPKSRCGDCAPIVPRFDYQFPGSASSHLLGLRPLVEAYEVQNALVYDMILPESRTPLECIVKAEQVSWSSDPVLVPVDVSGNTVLQQIRTDVSRFALTSCPLLSVVHLLYVRELQTDIVVEKFKQDQTLTIRMSFDPTVREEITANTVDPFTGISSAASCVRWDEKLRMWTPDGIQHVHVHLGAKNGTGAYVECKTSWLGIFAVSEVREYSGNEIVALDLCVRN